MGSGFGVLGFRVYRVSDSGSRRRTPAPVLVLASAGEEEPRRNAWLFARVKRSPGETQENHEFRTLSGVFLGGFVFEVHRRCIGCSRVLGFAA